MIEIDGSKGGGQMLRTALSLSAVTGKPFMMENVRGGRSTPGLKKQHIASVEAAQRLCGAEVEGDQMNSETVEFVPKDFEAEPFTQNIGTAGSITLLLDAVLPITTQFDTDFRLTVKGGTDVKWSPTLDYFKHVKLPLLRKFSMKASVDEETTGFYPKGGGEATLNTEEYSLEPVNLTNRGELQSFEIYSKASGELENQRVADRQADEAERMLKNAHMSVNVDKDVRYVETGSVGSSILIKAVYENSVAGFDALGEKGKPSEEVAEQAVKEFKSFHSSEAAVDENMADMLVPFVAIVGGEVLAPDLTPHLKTNLEVARMFLELEYESGKDVLYYSD